MKLDEKSAELEMIENSRQALEFKVKSLENSDSKFKAVIADLEENIRESEDMRKKTEDSLNKEITELRAQKRNLEKQIVEINEEFEGRLEEARNDLIVKLTQAEEFARDLQETIAEKDLALKEKAGFVLKLQGKNDEMEIKIEEYSSSVAVKERKIFELEDEVSKLSKKLEESLSESESISSGISASNERIRDLESQQQSHMLTIESLNQSLSSCYSKLESQSIEIKSLSEQLSESQNLSNELQSSLKSSEKSRSDLISRIDDLERTISKCQSEIKSLEEEKSSLIENSKQKRSASETENEEFDFSIAEPKELSNFLVCKVVRYENRTWCLIYVKNQSPEYNWYEKYFLQESYPSAEFPVPYEEQLESQIQSLQSKLELYEKIKSFPYPEDLRSLELLELLKELVNNYNQRRSIVKPIKIGSFEPDVSSPAISNFTGEHDMRSESEVQITAEEAGDLFKKMTALMRENEELENDKILLSQQLNFFKVEQRSDMFNKSGNSVDEMKPILVSILEKIPNQGPDIEKNINILLDMIGMVKEAKLTLTEKRNQKQTPEKSGFKKLFSKKKN